jgi:hypothetical protein
VIVGLVRALRLNLSFMLISHVPFTPEGGACRLFLNGVKELRWCFIFQADPAIKCSPLRETLLPDMVFLARSDSQTFL